MLVDLRVEDPRIEALTALGLPAVIVGGPLENHEIPAVWHDEGQVVVEAVQYLAALGHTRATLLGQSYGGGVAMQLAYQYPDRCERLILVSSGGLGREVSPLLRGLALPGAAQIFPLVCSPAHRRPIPGLRRR